MSDHCGFFALWNAICFLERRTDLISNFQEFQNRFECTDGPAFTIRYRSWVTTLQKSGVYQPNHPDLTMLYIEVLSEQDEQVTVRIPSLT